ncbi:hypothetical protein [Phenylobacterium sp.]|jgi:hypothetical protein|uniref:hypothetical protein n=1 Tax=Phenylobacterium sp. TaxID=1871053 RepID=UPI002E33B0CF|nr:hypothetical protein [Phenylobacterium sp.]HEX4710448.1 hypothetical protein [Phenylobacterium sp.]
MFPFPAPAGIAATALLVPVLMPVLKEGPLTLRVIDKGRGGKVLKARFDLLFHAAPKIISGTIGAQLIGISL